jgi:hypothetical protein
MDFSFLHSGDSLAPIRLIRIKQQPKVPKSYVKVKVEACPHSSAEKKRLELTRPLCFEKGKKALLGAFTTVPVLMNFAKSVSAFFPNTGGFHLLFVSAIKSVVIQNIGGVGMPRY